MCSESLIESWRTTSASPPSSHSYTSSTSSGEHENDTEDGLGTVPMAWSALLAGDAASNVNGYCYTALCSIRESALAVRDLLVYPIPPVSANKLEERLRAYFVDAKHQAEALRAAVEQEIDLLGDIRLQISLQRSQMRTAHDSEGTTGEKTTLSFSEAQEVLRNSHQTMEYLRRRKFVSTRMLHTANRTIDTMSIQLASFDIQVDASPSVIIWESNTTAHLDSIFYGFSSSKSSAPVSSAETVSLVRPNPSLSVQPLIKPTSYEQDTFASHISLDIEMDVEEEDQLSVFTSSAPSFILDWDISSHLQKTFLTQPTTQIPRWIVS